jgi:hypothetical protein
MLRVNVGLALVPLPLSERVAATTTAKSPSRPAGISPICSLVIAERDHVSQDVLAETIMTC